MVATARRAAGQLGRMLVEWSGQGAGQDVACVVDQVGRIRGDGPPPLSVSARDIYAVIVNWTTSAEREAWGVSLDRGPILNLVRALDGLRRSDPCSARPRRPAPYAPPDARKGA